jgi:hypothetical protein
VAPPTFHRTFVLRNLRPVQACFAILHTVGGVIDHPPPPHSSWNWLSVTAALSALSVVVRKNEIARSLSRSLAIARSSLARSNY